MLKHVAQLCTIFTGGTKGLTQLKSHKKEGKGETLEVMRLL